MQIFYILIVMLGLLPLLIGLYRLKPASGPLGLKGQIGSVLLCALGFNLTFFWQELWLVIPKALTPGLEATLYHNNHDWTGDLPIAELLQGTGAIATLASGILFAMGIKFIGANKPTWRLFFFWMAFQGLFQSLTQLAIGTLLTGNDVGRALSYLEMGDMTKKSLLMLTVLAMALCGFWLARLYSGSTTGSAGKYDRSFAYMMIIVTMVSIIVIVPFRVPRNIIEVALIPFFVNFVGLAWLVLGAAFVNKGGLDQQSPEVRGPAIALVLTLLFFQFVLRPGVTF